jgi:hypothetical protein
MKKLFILLSLPMLALSYSCNKESSTELNGDQSPMGEAGVMVSSSSAEIAGVSSFSATVTSLDKGISTYSATATVTNPLFKNMVANFPGIVISGDQVSITGLQVQQTKEGIKNLTGDNDGVMVKYASEVGDKYPIGSTGKERTVVSKTGVDDYYYGFYLIKTIQVEQAADPLKSSGITKYTYVYNHKYGLVGVKVDFDDGTSTTFPIYSSTEN